MIQAVALHAVSVVIVWVLAVNGRAAVLLPAPFFSEVAVFASAAPMLFRLASSIEYCFRPVNGWSAY